MASPSRTHAFGIGRAVELANRIRSARRLRRRGCCRSTSSQTLHAFMANDGANGAGADDGGALAGRGRHTLAPSAGEQPSAYATLPSTAQRRPARSTQQSSSTNAPHSSASCTREAKKEKYVIALPLIVLRKGSNVGFFQTGF